MASTLTSEPASPAPEPTAPSAEYGIAARIVLASLLAGAAVIHLAMAPVHAADSGLEGAGFAIVGWFQLILAAVLVLRPSRRWLQVAVVANLAFIGLWAWSRVVGLPVGAHPGVKEAVGTLDGLTVALQALLVVGAAVLLARPQLGRTHDHAAIIVASAVPVAVLVLTTTAIASPAASQHNHGGTTTASGPAPGSIQAQLASIDATRCDKDLNPVGYWSEAATVGVDTVGIALTDTSTPVAADGHNHSHGAATAAPATGVTTTTMADPLQGRGSPLVDKLVSKMNSSSEVDAGILVADLAGATDEEYQAFLYQLRKSGAGSHAHAATGDDTGGHGGHIGPNPWVAMTDAGQCDQLRKELDQARATALSMPTAADAQAAGYTQVTPYVPGIGAHWMKFSYVDGRFEVDKPEMVLYDGNGLDASVVGLSYYIVQPGDYEPTQGFTGDNDHYHRHIGLCQKGAMVIGDSTTTEEECAALGGKKATNRGGWMSHAWVVPGCESPWGMFSGATPVLDWDISKTSGQDGGACNGSKAKARYDLRPGGSTGAPPPASTTTSSAPASENAAAN